MMSFSAIPVTILSGFLGSGKTTLVNRLLREDHGRRLAIIENEYGEVGVDSELIERCADETVIELDNGCVCCTVRGDLANALARLAADREKGKITFDHVVIETTGLADPGPITRTFMAETAILEHYYLDGVVTIVDPLNAENILATRREARAQIAYADLLLITKCDLVDDIRIDAVKHRLKHMNAIAKIMRVDELSVDENFPDAVCDIRGFQFDRCGDLGEDIGGAAGCAQHGSECNGHHQEDLEHGHLHDVVSIHWESRSPLDGQRFDMVMTALADLYPETLWRIKGIVNIDGVRQRLVVQGVNGLLQVNPTTYWRPYEQRSSRLVLIGERIDRGTINDMLDSCALQSVKN